MIIFSILIYIQVLKELIVFFISPDCYFCAYCLNSKGFHSLMRLKVQLCSLNTEQCLQSHQYTIWRELIFLGIRDVGIFFDVGFIYQHNCSQKKKKKYLRKSQKEDRMGQSQLLCQIAASFKTHNLCIASGKISDWVEYNKSLDLIYFFSP